MSASEHMLGHGFYNLHAQAQGAANRFGLNLITEAVSQIDLARVGDTFQIADYGSAQGRNSILPVKTMIQAFRARSEAVAVLPVTVTHTDLPTNDWTTLFETVLTDPNSYMVGAPDVFPFASGISIYEQIFPPTQIALGYSAITTHWLSRTPSPNGGLIWSTRMSGTAHAAWAKQARTDWYAFLHARCTELIPSGQLVMVNSGADADGNSGAEPLIDLAQNVLQEMVQEGSLTAAEYAAMAIPTYYRVEKEWRAPFEDAEFVRANPLRLLHYEEFALEDVNLNQYAQTKNAQAFAQNDVAFFRAAFEPALFANLSPARDAAARQAVITTFTEKLEAALAKNPEAYPARWVLQLMWVAKQV